MATRNQSSQLREQLEQTRHELENAQQTISALVSKELDTITPRGADAPVLLGAAHHALESERRRFRAIFDSTADGVIIADAAWRCIDANPAACALLATSREGLLGRHVGDCLRDAAAAEDDRRRFLEHGSADGEIELVVGGRTRCVEFHARANIVPGIHLAVFRDITAARQAQVEHERLAAIVNSSADAIIGLASDGTIDSWNTGAEQLFGYSANEIIGRDCRELLPPERANERDQLLATVFSGQMVRGVETIRRRSDGSEVAIAVTASPIRDAKDNIVGASIICQDISERLRATQQLQAILESAPDAMIVIDERGDIVLINKTTEQLYGYARSEIVGRPCTLLIGELLRESREPKFARLASGSATEREIKVRRADGREIDVEVTLSLITVDQQTKSIAAVRDITERKQMREQLVLSDRMVTIGTLAAGVAHEINNPLVVFIANVELAMAAIRRMPSPSSDVLEMLREARDAAERVRLIVRDLKVFSRPDEERQTTVDVRRVLDSTLRMAWNEIRHRARLVKDYHEVPAVHANEARLGQVFMNLLVNAAQAIAEGNADHNEIRVTTSLDAAGFVEVSIADTGCGMTPEVMQRLFTPFYTTKPIGQGTGLGLSIARRLVTSAGGHIEVDSKPGVGTVFRVALPAASTPDDAPSPPGPVANRRRSARVLVIDDDAAIARSIEGLLEEEHDVVTCTSAAEALARLEAGEEYDVILCDLMMPQMTGMDLYERLAQVRPDTARRMIFMTGGAFTPRARAFLDTTGCVQIEKPFEPQHLCALVGQHAR